MVSPEEAIAPRPEYPWNMVSGRGADQDHGAYSRAAAYLGARPLLADTLLAVVLTGLGIGGLFATYPLGSERHADAVGAILVVGGHLPLAWRRRRPLTVMWVAGSATWLFWVLDYRSNFHFALLVAVYSGVAHSSDRRKAWVTSGALAAISAVVILVGITLEEDDVGLGTLVAMMAILGVAVSMGDGVRNRRAYLRELEDKAARSDAERIAEAQRAAAAERTRIARELHDVVAHSVSVMVVQAGAARRVLDKDRAQAILALENIEQTGRESLTEMRRVLGVLRDPDEAVSMSPQPMLDEFSGLIESCSAPGLEVELHVEGEARRLGAGLELAGYRIVQEALTNVMKHAGPAKVQVNLMYLPNELKVEVVDNGRGASADSGAIGNGLLGMRERVDLFGGELHTGPARGGGFRVRASLPLDADGLTASLT